MIQNNFEIDSPCIIEFHEYPYGFWWGKISQIDKIKLEYSKKEVLKIKAEITGGKFRVDECLNPIFNPKENELVICPETKSQTIFSMDEKTISLISRVLKLNEKREETLSKYKWLEDLHVKCKKE